MQQIALHEKFDPQVLDGTKTTTVRPGRLDYRLEPTKLGRIKVQVVEVAYTSLDRALRHHRTDGFRHPMDLLLALQEFYPRLKLTDEVTVVTFERIR